MSVFTPPIASSILAVATTVHLAMAALRHHRQSSRGSPNALAIVSVLLAAMPWLLPSVAGVALGLLLHVVWFLACERFAPAAAGQVAARGGDAPQREAGAAPRPAEARVSRPRAKPPGFVSVPVLAVLEEAPGIRTFRFARPEGFDFVAGQFLAVRVRADGRDHVRCYSISSAPHERGFLEISVKQQGLVSRTLHATLRAGSLASLKAPAGSFTYPADDDRALLLIAGGIGITPVLSMLRHAVAADPGRPITLLYSAQSVEALAFSGEIRQLARRHPQVRACFAITRGDGAPDMYPGRIDESLIQASVPDIPHSVAMICGPQPMIDGLRQTLTSLGMPAPQIRSEVFEAAVAATAGAAAHRVERNAADSAAHDVKCARSGTSIRAADGQTLLEATEAGGVEIDSLCRSGVCGTCRTRVLEGDVECRSSILDDTDRAGGFVLACVSRVRGDCVIEA